MACVSGGVYDFLEVTYSELSGVSFLGGKAVAEVGGGAVEGCAGEVTYRGDGGVECSADLSVEGVELGIAEEAELEGEVLADEETADDSYSAGLC
jgi:hypothetical protein